MTAERIEVTGVVQGVGFRPFVHRLATSLGLAGRVGNDASGVFLELAGPPDRLDELAARLVTDAPPLARVDTVTRRPSTGPAPAVGSGVRIVPSRPGDGPRTLVPPDTAVCDDCLAELFDPTDRRYRHPFITCTNCGPRFTIITGLPYDRPATTMAGFGLCPACAAEYRDPADRRYHAQPIACPQCGPTLSFIVDGATPAGGEDALAAARALLRAGGIVAVKGLGGYHLACDATDDRAVARLRVAKQRRDKPFAVLVADLAAAERLADIDEAAAAQLRAPARPVVLAPARNPSPLSGLVAPGNPLVGLLLAYTPVHHLLLEGDLPPLVLTSANLSGQPIVHRDDEPSRALLHRLADGVLSHDRPIDVPCDDSVVRVIGPRLLPVRRARGFAPVPVPMPGARVPVLAVGAELKSTFCLAAEGQAWVSQHLGDLGSYETLQAFEASVSRFSALYGLRPRVVAVDAHPGSQAAAWARRRYAGQAQIVEVQHHHAHVGSVLAEHGADPDRPVVGVAFDGTGYGPDGAVWGGEVLVATAHGFDRVAHLAPVPLPGGDAAVRNPYRVALAHLWAAGIPWSADLAPVAQLDAGESALLATALERGVACVPTTSMGRLFDAVASLVGLCHRITYEAQAAIDLEVAATRWLADHREPRRRHGGGHRAYRFGFDGPRLDPAPVLAAVVADRRAGVPVGAIAARFHLAVADAVLVAATVAAAVGPPAQPAPGPGTCPAVVTGPPLDTVALTGGVFQNVLLTELCCDRLATAGLRPLTHRVVPPNDGGLSLGQAWIAAHRAARETPEPAAPAGSRTQEG